MTKAKTKTTRKAKPVKMGSVDDMLAQGTPVEIICPVITIRATRTFDQMVRGETVVVDPTEKYWEDNIRGGNVEVIG